MRSPFFRSLVAVAAWLVCGAPPAHAGHTIWDATGFNPNRSTFSQLPYEHIDPMTGNLLLTFTDLELPGNAGFNLRIQRTFNSKALHRDYEAWGALPAEDSWSGAGWILHLGRVFEEASLTNPIVEMPDGSRHEMYPHLRPPSWCSSQCYVSKDYWVYDRINDTLRLPNGVVYTFGQYAVRAFVPGGSARYATLIQDTFGNSVTLTYRTAPSDALNTIVQNLQGGQTRTITFTTNTQFEYLTGMTYGSSTWSYTQILPAGTQWNTYRWLTAVTAPQSLVWSFAHDSVTGEITRMTTPLGGWIDYTYADRTFRLGPTSVDGDTLARAVIQRTTGGRDIPSGTWTYAYASGPLKNQSVVTSPCSTTTYTFLGIGDLTGTEPFWRIGLQGEKETTGGAGEKEAVETVWRASDAISPQGQAMGSWADPQTWVPLVDTQTITRSSTGAPDVTYTTTHTYRPDATFQTFNDYGRPDTTIEAGQLSRKTTRVFQYGFTPYIVDRVESETVQALAPGTSIPIGTAFQTSYTYSSATGFLTSKNVYGVVTTLTPDSKGNVATGTDGVGNTTTFTYDWGVPKTVRTEEYGTDLITRVINSNGTIASETRRGSMTSFTYDTLFRPTSVDPQLGNTTTTAYVLEAGVWTRTDVTRGGLTVRSYLDGFGRVSSTQSMASGVLTDTTYDACDRKSYESYPYTAANIGTNYVYDGLGRVTEKQNPPAPGPTSVSYVYFGNEVRITDEESRLTVQTWSGYGDPGAAVLQSVREPNNQTTLYEYDVLGSLTFVDPPLGANRTWTYNTKGQLEQESQPENNGPVTYTYYDNGSLRTRADGMGTTTFIYDAMNRLKRVDRPGTAYDTNIQYDQSDNRTLVENGYVRSVLGPYDDANRLPTRVDTIAGQAFTTSYTYDNNDNLKTITYPMGTTRKVDYDYDSANRITQVDNAATPTPFVYANLFQYHPSGALTSYRAGNNLTHSFTYDQRYRVDTLNAGGALQLDYGYDNVGNVTSIADTRPGMSQTFGYDTLDRLNVANGPWGNGTFDYDNIGNRTLKQIGSSVTNYNYPSQNRLSGSTGDEPDNFTYDWNGNLKTTNTSTFSYTPENQVEVATVTGVATTYRYDSDNLRKLKQEADGTLRYYVHGPGNQILTEFRKPAAGPIEVVRDYVYAGSRLVAALKPAVLTVAPQAMSFIVVRTGAAAAPQSLAITTANETGVSWTASETTSWLSLAPTSGTTPGNVNVSVNHTGLANGTYTATVTVTAPNAVGSPQQVTVTLHVIETAALTIAPTSLRFDMVQDRANPGPKLVNVLFPYTSVSWRTTVSAPWLQVAPATGTTPGQLTVSVNGAGLTAGTYQATVGVIADGVAGSPKTVVVTFVIEPPAGATCASDAWYCEPFDGLTRGSINGQGGWFALDAVAVGQVDADPRGVGHAFILDPPAGEVSVDQVNVPDHAIDRTEISMHVRLGDLPQDQKQVGKLEFFTSGNAWGKTGRTFGAIRMAGGIIYVQYGPNIYKRIVDNAESNRFYDVKVRYRNGRIDAIVDGTPRFSTTNVVPGTQPIQAFVATGWDLPGSAWIDMLQARPLAATQQPELYVDPLILNFSGVQTASLDTNMPETRMASGGTTAAPSADKVAALPMVFEPNVGQGPADAKFLARGAGYAVLLKSEGPDLSLGSDSLGLRLKGARSPEPKAEQSLEGKSNYFIGGDSSKWRTGVPHFGRVRYEEVYDGIDAVFYGNQRRLEYDLEVRPGADPNVVRMSFDGATALRVDEGGDLVISTARGEVRQLVPVAYQRGSAGREPVKVAYAVADDRSVSLIVGEYDRRRSLVIDPVLTYSTLVGGTANEQANGIAVDAQGYVYIAGTTSSDDLPVNTSIQSARGGDDDAFVTKLNRDGTSIIYSTYLGGTGTDRGVDLTVDGTGSVYVVGTSWGGQFPVVNAIMPTQTSNGSFLARLDAEGSQLEFSTYISGNSGGPTASAVRLRGGKVYVAGHTSNNTLIAGHGVSKVNLDYQWLVGPFVARLTPDGQDVEAVVVLNGGGGYNNNVRLGFDGAGAVYLAGNYGSTPPSFADKVRNPVPLSTSGWLGAAAYNDGGFHITKLGPLSTDAANATPVVYSALIGGGNIDMVESLFVDTDGNAYVAGQTTSGLGGAALFPTTAGAISTTFGGVYDGFLLKLNPGGTAPVYSTYLGGPAGDYMYGIDVDPLGRAVVVGRADTTGYPAAGCVSKQTFGTTGLGAAVLVVDPTGSAYEYCGFIGDFYAYAYGVDVDSTGAIFVAGKTSSSFYTTPGAFQSTATAANAWVAKFSGIGAPGSAGTFQFSGPTYSGSESGSCVSITVTRTGSTSGYASVTYSTADGTAGALDYVSVSDTILFEPGETSKTFAVPIQDDAMVEPTETVNLTLSAPTDGAGLGTQRTAVLSILDNDTDGALSKTFVVRDRFLGAGPPWTATIQNAPWLQVTPMSGIGPSTATATATTSGLVPGTYNGTVTITAPGALASPQIIQVRLVVTAP